MSDIEKSKLIQLLMEHRDDQRKLLSSLEICLARRRTTQLTNGHWPKGKVKLGAYKKY